MDPDLTYIRPSSSPVAALPGHGRLIALGEFWQLESLNPSKTYGISLVTMVLKGESVSVSPLFSPLNA